MSIADIQTPKSMDPLQVDVARRVAIKEEIERLDGELALIDDRIRDHCEFGNTVAGDWVVQLQHNRQLDKARLERDFPVAKFPHLYKAVLDTASVNEHIAKSDRDAYYVEARAKVLVR